MNNFFAKLFNSFKYAFAGIKIILKGNNFKIMLCFEIFLLILGAFFKITLNDLLIVLVLMGILFTLEAVNTLLEKLMDFFEADYSKRVKDIKDISAAAVLIFSFFTVLCELIIYLKYFIKIILPLFVR